MTTMLEEQETTITIERTQEMARIYTCDDTFKTKMREAGHTPYKTEGDGEFFKIDKVLVSIRSKRTKMNLTNEQREILRARGKEMRAAQILRNKATVGDSAAHTDAQT
jgi:hypothetical protein